MTKSIRFLVQLSAAAALAAGVPAHASVPLPLRGTSPELLAAAMLGLAALAFAVLLQRRARGLDERNRALEQQLEAERSAHADAETALAGSHEVLCRLVHGQESVRETERSRIARDLHDELGHRLLSLRVELALQQAAVRGTSPAVHDKLTTAIANLDGALRAVRSIVTGLRPIAPGVSLRQAAGQHLAEFARLHGLDYRFEAGADPVAEAGRDHDVEAVLFRALQEALSNVAHHAQATTVCVTLVDSAAGITLTVEDDGIGPAPGADAGRGCGLDGMRERAQALGGSMRLAAGRRGGAVVTITLPVRREAHPA